MDKTIRRNETCIIGLPRCDFVFSSTRTCFIAYGFKESPIEMGLLRKLLEERGIQPVEAGGALAPAQNAYCAKICSKIITSQFCIVLLNNDEGDGREIPNANVNMEYGLMLGFNKYVLPFQRATQKLPFNVGGLDTIKYTNTDFERLAGAAINQAIRETQQDISTSKAIDQVLEVFLLAKKMLFVVLDNDGDRNLFKMGEPLGFSLLHDFSGNNYRYFGNFTSLRAEIVVWRVRLLGEILADRRLAVAGRAAAGLVASQLVQMFEELLHRLQVWLLVTSDDEKIAIQDACMDFEFPVQAFSISDVESELSTLS